MPASEKIISKTEDSKSIVQIRTFKNANTWLRASKTSLGQPGSAWLGAWEACRDLSCRLGVCLPLQEVAGGQAEGQKPS